MVEWLEHQPVRPVRFRGMCLARLGHLQKAAISVSYIDVSLSPYPSTLSNYWGRDPAVKINSNSWEWVMDFIHGFFVCIGRSYHFSPFGHK